MFSGLVRLSCRTDEVLIDLVLKANDIQPLLHKGIFGPFSGSPNRLSYGVFPSDKKSGMFRR